MTKFDLKTNEEIQLMREGGKIAAQVLAKLSEVTKAGMTTAELNRIAEKMILDAGATPSFKGFHDFPAGTCISINSEIVHGIPSEKVLEDGDIVGIDVGVFYKGFHTDTAITIGIGEISPKAQKLIDITKKSLMNGLTEISPGKHLGDAQFAIQKTIENAGYGAIRELTGHGVGRNLQEAPSIPNYGEKGKGLVLEEGMTLAIEPMVSMGDWRVQVQPDDWTVVTADGSLSAHFEHTIAVTKDGYEILTEI